MADTSKATEDDQKSKEKEVMADRRRTSSKIDTEDLKSKVKEAMASRSNESEERNSEGEREAKAIAKLGITVEKSLTESRINEIGIRAWPDKWKGPIDMFAWVFDDNEYYYFVEGKVRVYPYECGDENEYVELNAGDMVAFPKGLMCRWNVIEPFHTLCIY